MAPFFYYDYFNSCAACNHHRVLDFIFMMRFLFFIFVIFPQSLFAAWVGYGGIHYTIFFTECPIRAAGLPWKQGSSTGQYISCQVYEPPGTPCDDDPGTSWNQDTFECDVGCESGSLAPDCAVDCPALEYTYYLNGVARRGRIGAGTVGHGRSCPQPSFPSGSDSGCVGSPAIGAPGEPGYIPGACSKFPTAINEGENVTQTETNTEVNGDTTTETITSSSHPGHSSTGGMHSGSSDGSVIDSSGGTNFTQGQDGVSNETINIGDRTFALCDHGGIVDGTISCDYVPGNCAANQVSSSHGCVSIPSVVYDDTPPTTTTQTTVDPVTGNSTTTTIETSGTTGGQSNNEEGADASSASLSGECTTPPSCDGDAIQCAQLTQIWRSSCGLDKSVLNALDCSEEPACEGDPVGCASLIQRHAQACELRNLTAQNSQVDQFVIDNNLKTVDQIEAELVAEGFQAYEQVDVGVVFDGIDDGSVTSGSCPENINISLGGRFGDLEIDISGFCTFFTWIGYLVRLSASIFAFNILFSTIRSI